MAGHASHPSVPCVVEAPPKIGLTETALLAICVIALAIGVFIAGYLDGRGR